MVFKLIASSPDNIGMMKDFTEFDDLVRSFMLLQGGCTADDTPSVRGRVENFNLKYPTFFYLFHF